MPFCKRPIFQETISVPVPDNTVSGQVCVDKCQEQNLHDGKTWCNNVAGAWEYCIPNERGKVVPGSVLHQQLLKPGHDNDIASNLWNKYHRFACD